MELLIGGIISVTVLICIAALVLVYYLHVNFIGNRRFTNIMYCIQGLNFTQLLILVLLLSGIALPKLDLVGELLKNLLSLSMLHFNIYLLDVFGCLVPDIITKHRVTALRVAVTALYIGLQALPIYHLFASGDYDLNYLVRVHCLT
jgi:hypothetical protein